MPLECGADPDFQDMVRSFFGRELAERERADAQRGFDAEAWEQLDEMGFAQLTASEDRGGSGASLAEAVALLYAVGGHGVAVPYAEHDLLAAWLTEQVDLPPVTGPTSLVILPGATAGAPAPGDAFSAPVAEGVERLLAVRLDAVGGAFAGGIVIDLAAADFDIVSTEYTAAEARSELRLTAAAQPAAIPAEVARELWLRGALARSVQIVGALDRCVAEAAGHAAVRVQFGRPLTRFQAVQALLADASAEAAVAAAAVEWAVVAWLEAGEPTVEVERAIAVAKSCAAHAVEPVTRNAHQVLGAMGTTLEHDLHRFTLPPLLWRDEFGSARDWDAWIARDAVADGGKLWAKLAPIS